MCDPSMSTDPTQTVVFLHHFLSLLIYTSSNNQPTSTDQQSPRVLGLFRIGSLMAFHGFRTLLQTNPKPNQPNFPINPDPPRCDGKIQLPLEPPLGSWRPAECPASRFGRQNRSAAAWQRWPGRRCRWCLPLATDGSHLSLAGHIGPKTWGHRWKIYLGKL